MCEFVAQNAIGNPDLMTSGNVRVAINGILFQLQGGVHNAVRYGRTPNALIVQSAAVDGVPMSIGMRDWIKLSGS